MENTVYVPEMDFGASLKGEAVNSALMWIPKDKVPNKAAILNAATVTTTDRDGSPIHISLAEEVGDYIVTAKHLFPNWEQQLGEVVTPEINFEEVGFIDHEHIKPWNDAQQRAWDAFSPQNNGILNLACGKGKALRNGEPVQTPHGPIPIEVLQKGTPVLGTDGKVYKVTGVYPQGIRSIYEITFTDNTKVQCDDSHLWSLVKRRDRNKEVVISTKNLLEESLQNRAGRRFFLPSIVPAYCEPSEVPLDPYFLGVLLGDGGISQTNVYVTTMDEEILASCKLPKKYRFKKLAHQNSEKASTYLVSPTRSDGQKVKRRLYHILSSMQLMGTTSHTKFIPNAYKYNSLETRVGILQGLLDTDGSPTASSAIDYITASPQLCQDVKYIVYSLGGTAVEQKKIIKYNGKNKQYHRLYIKLPDAIKAFRLTRKQESISDEKRQRAPYRAIKAIQYIGEHEATCISVNSPNRLFLTRNFIPTHNTVLALKKIAQRKYPALVIVNNTGLLDQWIRRAMDKKFLGLPRTSIGLVRQKKQEWDKPLVIAMIQTLCKRVADLPMDIRQRFGTIIWDESHRLAAPRFILTAPAFYGARFGLTATKDRPDGLEAVYMAHLGKEFYQDLTTDMPARTYFKKLPIKIDMRNRKILDVRGEFSRGKFHIFLSQMHQRNKYILNEVSAALEKGRRILVLVHAADHSKILGALAANDKRYKGLNIGVIHAKCSGKERLDILDTCNPIFASFEIAKEGLDSPSLDTLLVATPTKSWNSFQQGKGRIERFFPGKKPPIVVYLEDSGVAVSRAMCSFIRRELRSRGYTYKQV